MEGQSKSGQKATATQVIRAYKETGSIWEAAKRLGMCGQSVWERLRALDYPLQSTKWTIAEIDELRALAGHCTISEIAARLGRPYAGVAGMISKLGLTSNYGNRRGAPLRKREGYNKQLVTKRIKQLTRHEGSLRQFCRVHGLDLERFVKAVQRYDIDFWRRYSREQTNLTVRACGYCSAEFHPMSVKQLCCSRKCSDDMRRDQQYFGGRRRDAVGLLEGICQLCEQQKPKGLSAHHVIGKENDPDNTYLIALCTGCHQLVGRLGGRKFIDSPRAWENLIGLALARRLADHNAPHAGVHVTVDLEYLTESELLDIDPAPATPQP